MKVQNSDATLFKAKMVIKNPSNNYVMDELAKKFQRLTESSPNDVVNLTILGGKNAKGYRLSLGDGLNDSVILTESNFDNMKSAPALLDTFVKTFNALKVNSKYNQEIGLLKEDKNKLDNITKDSVAFYVNNKKDDSRLIFFSKVKDYANSCKITLKNQLENLQAGRENALKELSTDKLNFIDLLSYSIK